MRYNITIAEIRAIARRAGAVAVGMARVEPMDPAPLHAWLSAGYAAEMTYLHRHADVRGRLDTLLPGARSVICLAAPYPDALPAMPGGIARYARGRDYHEMMDALLRDAWNALREHYPDAAARHFVDSGPLPERELARRAGLGWIGRHGCVIVPGYGSRVVLGEIITTLDLPTTAPLQGDCGDCRRCLNACPTGALCAPGVVDARRCLSYLTIEHRGAMPDALRAACGTRLFGCDACQDACPHNPRVDQPRADTTELCALLRLTDAAFRRQFRGTAVLRARQRGMARNACVVMGNDGDPAAIPALREAETHEDPLVCEHAKWALAQLTKG